MSAVFGRRSRRLDPGRRERRWGLLSAALLTTAVVGAAAARAETLSVAINSARLLRLPAQVATVVIGNPLIADASLQRGGVLVITGKGYGTTNLLALDRDGRVVLDKTVRVKGPSHRDDLVVVYRGMDREVLQLRAALRTAHHPRRFRQVFHLHHGPDRGAQQRRPIGRRPGRRRRRQAFAALMRRAYGVVSRRLRRRPGLSATAETIRQGASAMDETWRVPRRLERVARQ